MFGMNILPQFRYYRILEIMMFFRDKKGFWCIKITNQVISLLKGYTKDITNLMKEHSFLHLWLRVWPFMNILPHHSRICEYLSIRNPLLIWKNLAPWDLYILIATKPFIPISCQKNLPTLNCVLNFDLQKICPTLNCVSNFDLQIRSPKNWRSPIISPFLSSGGGASTIAFLVCLSVCQKNIKIVKKA